MRYVLCLLAVAILLLTVFNATSAYGPNPTVLKIVPPPSPPITIWEGQNFTVSVDIYGAMNMQSFQFKISWDTTFVDYVSHSVFPPWQPPTIIPDPVIDKTQGYIVIGAISISTTFTGNAVLANVTLNALKSGTTSITISEPTITPNPIILESEDAAVTILPSKTWINMAGVISSYGSSYAHGFISTFAMLDEWAEGLCVFSVPPLGPIIMIYPPPPFNYTLYIARIVNASIVKLNYNQSDFYVSGFWEIANISSPVEIDELIGLLEQMTLSTGELSVTGNWTNFTLNIEGLESINGSIMLYLIRELRITTENPPYGDLNYDHIIDMKDIGVCTRAFGSLLGVDGYEFYADLNFDVRIDMKDIGKVVKNFGTEY